MIISQKNYSDEFVKIKNREIEHAINVIDNIDKNPDPFLRYKTGRPITDIKQMFESSASIYGENVAFRQKFIKGGSYQDITYKKALDDVNSLGTALIEHGLKGKRIGIIGETCYQWESSYLAVIGGVGIVVPLDKELSKEELKFLIQDAEVSAVIYGKKYDSVFREIRDAGDTNLEYLINFDKDMDLYLKSLDDSSAVSSSIQTDYLDCKDLSWAELIAEGKRLIIDGNRRFIDAEIIADEMAVILYTSGTTGFAKGVMLSNTNLCENLMAAPTILNVNSFDIFFSVLPVHHTYECTCAFLMPLYKGASIAYMEGLKYIAKNMEEVKPTMLLGVPVLIETLYKRIWKAARDGGKDNTLRKLISINNKTKKFGLDFSKIFTKDIRKVFGGRMRVIISGGAAIDPDILQFFNDIGIIAVQGYGLTECSPMAALNPDVEKDMRNSSVGHVLPGMEVKIIDKDENGIGEICFKGPNIMMGYYKNKEATDQVLIDGWFHTGDLGYVDNENFVYITGRKKNVIITDSGKNVFPEELEYELSKIPYISESMVWGSEDKDSSNDKSIVATVTIDEEAVKEALGNTYSPKDLEEIVWKEIDKINERIPYYKRIKKVVVRHREFEKTTGKKIKRFVEDNKNA